VFCCGKILPFSWETTRNERDFIHFYLLLMAPNIVLLWAPKGGAKWLLVQWEFASQRCTLEHHSAVGTNWFSPLLPPSPCLSRELITIRRSIIRYCHEERQLFGMWFFLVDSSGLGGVLFLLCRRFVPSWWNALSEMWGLNGQGLATILSGMGESKIAIFLNMMVFYITFIVLCMADNTTNCYNFIRKG
jgi:hypothetical protein